VKFKVDDITAEAKETTFPAPAAPINEALSGSGGGEFRIEAPVTVAASYYRAGTEVFFDGELIATMHATCARCAEEFSTPTARPFHFILAPRVLFDDADGAADADTAGYAHYDGDVIDLGPLIREEMLLGLPTRALCREDCRGLCPRCGANLNEGACRCTQPPGDSRLAVLRTLKIQRS